MARLDLPAPFYLTGDHIGVSLAGARAVFTTRRGGYSTGPYDSLNLGRWTDDDPAAVRRNRDSLAAWLKVGFAFGRQVHGTAVVQADRPSAPGDQPAPSDGQATATAGVGAMVLAADCLPVAIAGQEAVAMVHAGWRGLAGGVIAQGVRALRDLGAGSELVAAIGPGAGPCCFEVGDEVRTQFAAYGDGVRRGRNLDLKAIAARQLDDAGVDEIHDTGLCTICSDPSLFYSHRRDRGVTGRQAGVAWLAPADG